MSRLAFFYRFINLFHGALEGRKKTCKKWLLCSHSYKYTHFVSKREREKHILNYDGTGCGNGSLLWGNSSVVVVVWCLNGGLESIVFVR
jgi:hypothetical protein